MRDGHLPPLAKGLVFGAVLGLHVAAWAVMASGRGEARRDDDGGAPVIVLTELARAQFDGTGASQASAPATATTAAAAKPPSPVAPTPERPTPRTAPEAPAAPSTEAFAPPPQPTRSDAPSSDGPADASREGARQAEAGATAGGGARTLGASATSAEDDYAAKVIAWVERHKGRPNRSLRGAVVVRFVLDRQGRLRAAAVAASSGDRSLDAVAIEALRAAQPYPRPTAGAAWRTREFHVRLEYRPEAGG